MATESIEFVIGPDGVVTERTLGIKGVACEEVTARIEAALGEIVSREATPERYETPQESTLDQTRQQEG